MNKKARKEALAKIQKQAAQEALLKKVAEDTDINNATDASDYADKVLEKILTEVIGEGLEP
jgi:hypothetical protein